MPRYIDADALEKKMSKRYSDICKEYSAWDAYCQGYDDAISALLDAPTADVQEVVHCKDCKYWKSPFDNDAHYCMSKGISGLCAEDDYCSLGEKKDGDEK